MIDKSGKMNELRIKSCEFKRDFVNAKGVIYYYYKVGFEDGSVEEVGTITKNPPHLKPGQMLMFHFDKDTGRIKVTHAKKPNPGASTQSPARHKTYPSKTTVRVKDKSDPFVGFIWSYAKDLVIAGKTAEKDLEDLKKIAKFIHSNLSDMLSSSEAPPLSEAIADNTPTEDNQPSKSKSKKTKKN